MVTRPLVSVWPDKLYINYQTSSSFILIYVPTYEPEFKSITPKRCLQKLIKQFHLIQGLCMEPMCGF